MKRRHWAARWAIAFAALPLIIALTALYAVWAAAFAAQSHADDRWADAWREFAVLAWPSWRVLCKLAGLL